MELGVEFTRDFIYLCGKSQLVTLPHTPEVLRGLSNPPLEYSDAYGLDRISRVKISTRVVFPILPRPCA